jgi:phosphomethylpyrimidine synthase
MSTQLDEALKGRVTPAMEAAARAENITPQKVCREVAGGRAVIPANPKHAGLQAAVVGRAFRTKINANLGRSADASDRDHEIHKLRTALCAGADFVMDLSVGPDLAAVRAAMLEASAVALGTVPVYEAMSRCDNSSADLTDSLLVEVIDEQARQGVDFMTIHAGLLREHIPLTKNRLMGIVSRGGAIIAEWMALRGRENPFYTRWNDIMAICSEHDVTVSLGDGLRPGCLSDAGDAAQFAELDAIGGLVHRCRKRGVQVMVEGPGHVPFDQIQMQVEREQEVCDHAPFYVLGPVVTDIAPGYDHITSAIGATAAAYHGASLLCYVTPAEHLALPNDDEVRRGVVACRIAAHAADVARGLPGARDADDAISRARVDFDWQRQFEIAIDGSFARQRFEQVHGADMHSDHCSMCGRDFCAVRTSKRLHEAPH